MTTLEDPLIGTQLGNFRLERQIGHGGMALVYYGQDVKLQRPVAIKVIHTRYRTNPTYAQRFVREAQSVATWRHENIIQIFYADEQEHISFFVMEYIDGQDLATVLADYATNGELMPHEDVLRIGWAVAGALDYAHERGLIHRDIKPANVLIERGGRIVLTDFGLALDMQQGSIGEVLGTPHYISPEQAKRSSDATPLSDIYSLGVILYEMLVGVVPFDDPSPTSVALQHLTMEPPSPRALNPRLTQAVEDVLLWALAKKPDKRPKNTAELMRALEKSLTVEPATGETLARPQGASTGGKPSSIPSVAAAAAMGLPPLPAGVVAPMQRALSPVTLFDKMDVLMAAQDARAVDLLAAPQPAAAPVSPPTETQALWRLFALAGGVTAAMVLLVLVIWLVAGTPAPVTSTVTPTTTQSATSGPTATIAPITLIQTHVVIITATPPPSPIPSATAQPTPTPGPVTPTVRYPEGRPFMLVYGPGSFYIVNLSGAFVSSVEPFIFERISSISIGERFSATELIYPAMRENGCSRIQVLGQVQVQRPVECLTEEGYIERNSTGGAVFWTEQEGSEQFRVFWQGLEVARCPTGSATCLVRIP